MKPKEKIIIDLEEFFARGKFDFLTLGKTKEWIINNFPDPDGFDKYPEIFQDNIWRYGNIELHFSDEKLFLIFSDYIDKLDGGNFLELKKWFLENTKKLTLSDVISELNKKHIDFQKRTNKTVQGTIHLKLISGVELNFHLSEVPGEGYENFLERCKKTDQSEFILGSFSLMKK